MGGQGALCKASHAMPVMQGKPRDARYAKHEWARVGCRAYAAPSKR